MVGPAAFLSYARFDDRHHDGLISDLRARLSAEVRLQTGAEFPIFQDRADIAWGQNWQARIDDALDAVTLLLPVVTPGFFRSPACRAEVERFLARERALGRRDLILPIYLVSAPEFDDPVRREADDLSRELWTRQFADWRDLRFEPLTSPAARRAVAALATQIRTERLPALVTSPPPPAAPPPSPTVDLPRGRAAFEPQGRAAELDDGWWAPPRNHSFSDLIPPENEWGSESSITGLRAPIGFQGHAPAEVVLGDETAHVLIGGPTGSGKTNVLLTLVASLAVRYSPDDLEFYLLDFKESVSFAPFARRRDGTYLPHARLVGVNINSDREYGMALLEFLSAEMRRRAEAARQHEVTNLADLRSSDPANRWPRVVAVVDEFQFLFAQRDALSERAAALLADLARRGRAQGIHLVFCTQDIEGIDGLTYVRSVIFEQFVVRIALPRGRVLHDRSDPASLDLPRWHAVLNHASGVKHDNRTIRLADATKIGTIHEVQRKLHERYRARRPRPALFDGSRTPGLSTLVNSLPAGDRSVVHSVVGQRFDIDGSAAAFPLTRTPDRNLAVLGTSTVDAIRVLTAAAKSLASQFQVGGASIFIAPLIPESAMPAEELARSYQHSGLHAEIVPARGLQDLVRRLAAEVRRRVAGDSEPTIIFTIYAGDTMSGMLDAKGMQDLNDLVGFGAATGVHVMGWWRIPERFYGLLRRPASARSFGVLVALNLYGAELPLGPFGVEPYGLGPSQARWSPRPGRGLFVDRSLHAKPSVFVLPDVRS